MDAPQAAAQHIDAAQTESLDDDALISHSSQHIKDRRIQAGGQLQQEHVFVDLRAKLCRPGGAGKYLFVDDKAVVAHQTRIAGVDALKSGEAGGAHLHGPAAQHHLSVKSQEDTGLTGSGHGKGGAQIVRPVGEHICQGQLGTGEYHRQVDVGQHIGNGRGGVGHGICAMGDDDAVKTNPMLENIPGQLLPFLRADVGGIQAHHIPDGNVIVGTQLVQFPFHHIAALGLQALPSGERGNGTAGGQQQDFFSFCPWRIPPKCC